MNRIIVGTIAALFLVSATALAQEDAPQAPSVQSSCGEPAASIRQAPAARPVRTVARGVARVALLPVRLVGRVAANVQERRAARIERRQARRAARQAARYGCGG